MKQEQQLNKIKPEIAYSQQQVWIISHWKSLPLYVVKTLSLHSKAGSVPLQPNRSFDLYTEITEIVSDMCVVLNVGPHDFYISFCFIRLFMDYMFSIYQVVKKMQAMLCGRFVLHLLLFIKRLLKSKCQLPLGFSPAELEDEMQLCLRGGVAMPSVPCLPKRNLLPGVGHHSSP